MASYRNIVLIALFFLIATTPRTHGVILGDIAQVNVIGRLSCVVPGTLSTLSGITPLRRVAVNITCNGGTITLGQAVTNPIGLLNATFNVVEGLLLESSTCLATANLSSIGICRLLPPTGVLRTSLQLVRVVQGVAQLVTGPIFV